MNLNINTNDKGNLSIGGADALELAEQYGTPLYAIDENRIRDNFRRLNNAFKTHYENFQIFYACKANTNLSVMRILEQEGCGIDAVSPGEVYTAIQSGINPQKILFTGNNVKDEEMEFVIESGARLNVDSVSQLKRLAKIVDPKGFKISFRVNPMVGAGHHEHTITGGKKSKFGIMDKEAVEVYAMAKEMGFDPVGIHMHIGSGFLDIGPFKLAVNTLMDIAGEITQKTGIKFEFIDFGGGMGIPYTPEEELLDIEPIAEEIIKIYKAKLDEYDMGKPTMCLEPGRYIVGDSTYLLARVNSVKEGYKKFVGVDAGFNTLIRPAMYDSYHHIVIADKPEAEATQTVDVAGNVCESGDLFGRDRPLPDVEEGDLIAILNAGAYGFTMASRYNSRPLPAEVLVNNGEVDVIRERETLADLFAHQVIPARLLKKD